MVRSQRREQTILRAKFSAITEKDIKAAMNCLVSPNANKTTLLGFTPRRWRKHWRTATIRAMGPASWNASAIGAIDRFLVTTWVKYLDFNINHQHISYTLFVSFIPARCLSTRTAMLRVITRFYPCCLSGKTISNRMKEHGTPTSCSPLGISSTTSAALVIHPTIPSWVFHGFFLFFLGDFVAILILDFYF